MPIPVSDSVLVLNKVSAEVARCYLPDTHQVFLLNNVYIVHIRWCYHVQDFRLVIKVIELVKLQDKFVLIGLRFEKVIFFTQNDTVDSIGL